MVGVKQQQLPLYHRVTDFFFYSSVLCAPLTAVVLTFSRLFLDKTLMRIFTLSTRWCSSLGPFKTIVTVPVLWFFYSFFIFLYSLFTATAVSWHWDAVSERGWTTGQNTSRDSLMFSLWVSKSWNKISAWTQTNHKSNKKSHTSSHEETQTPKILNLLLKKKKKTFWRIFIRQTSI